MNVGVDVSKYNIGWNPDAAQRDISFVIQRASWSMYKDEKFDEMYKQVAKIPIRGAYHYYSSGVNWKLQADMFLNIVSEKNFHFYVLDYEKAFNNLTARTTAEVAEFVKYIKDKSNKICMIYFNQDVYNTAIKAFGYDNWANQQDVWIAQYPWTLTETISQNKPYMPSGLKNWKIWQYGGGDIAYTAGRYAGANYGGGLQGIDLNTYNGSIAEMRSWLGLEKDPPIIPPINNHTIAVVAKSNMNVRSGPGTNYSVIGGLVKNSTAVLEEVVKINSNSVWGKMGEDRYVCLYLNGFYYTNLTNFD